MNATTLGELARSGALEFSDGYRTKQPELAREGYRILRAGDVRDGRPVLDGPDFVAADFGSAIGRKTVRAGDVVLTTKGTVGRTAFVFEVRQPAVYSPQLCFFRPDPSVMDPRFLYYWLSGPEFLPQSLAMKSSTDMAPYISLSQLASTRITLPTLADQRTIAEVLGALDDKIASNAELESTSESLIAALFASACETGAVRRPLMEALNVTFGEPFKGDQFAPHGRGRPLLRIRDIKQRSCDTWTTEFRDRETLIQPGQVVAGMDAEFRPRFWLGEPSLLNQRVCLVESSEFGPAFAREMAVPALAQIEGEKSGTTVIHMNKADLQRVWVSVPDSEASRRHAAVASAVLDRLVIAAQESRKLAELRDTLLPALMDGTIRVKDAIATTEEAL